MYRTLFSPSGRGLGLAAFFVILVIALPAPARETAPATPCPGSGPALIMLSPCHLVTLSPCHLLAVSPSGILNSITSSIGSKTRLVQLGVVVMCIALFIMFRAAKF